MKNLEISKIFFYASLIICLLGLSFAFGLYSGVKKTVVYRAALALHNSIELVLGEMPTLSKTSPEHFLYTARYNGSGVTVNDYAASQNELIFLGKKYVTLLMNIL